MPVEFAGSKPTSNAGSDAGRKPSPKAHSGTSAGRPYAKKLAALRAAKSPPCDCGDEAHHSAETAGGAKVAPPHHPKHSSAQAGHKGVGSLDSRGA